MDGMDPEILNIKADFSEKIEVSKLALQHVFDNLVHSMDFGSGFLDSEDVDALREVAKTLGVNPMDATPKEFASSYPHPYEQYAGKDWRGVTWSHDYCRRCSRVEAWSCHVTN